MGGLPGDDGEVFNHPLYALPYRPRDGEESFPREPLPEWFRDLLTGTEDTFALFIDGGKELSDWGVAADMARYRAHANRIVELCAAREGIEASLVTCRGNLDLTAARLANAHAANRLPAFRTLADRSWCTYGDEGPPLHTMHHGPKRATVKRARGRVPA
jgi:hypothetical protein